MLTTISILNNLAPHAVFTKTEAAEKARKIIAEILADDDNDDYTNLLLDVNVSIEDFDSEHTYDVLLDDVRFVTWDMIDSVITSQLAALEARKEDLIC